MTRKYHRDVWLGLVLLIFCAAVFFNAAQISGQASYLPVALSIMMAMCALFIILKGLRLTKEQQGNYNYSMTLKGSKYAWIFMFFIFPLVNCFPIVIAIVSVFCTSCFAFTIFTHFLLGFFSMSSSVHAVLFSSCDIGHFLFKFITFAIVSAFFCFRPIIITKFLPSCF